MSGRLIGIGVGPGDPDLLTLRALRALGEAERVFVPGGAGRAERVIAAHVEPERIERLTFAMSDAAERERRWDAAAAAIAARLGPGRTVAFCTLGDPSLYSTFTHVAERLPDVTVEVVPGITAMQQLAAQARVPLAVGDEPLVLMPVLAGGERRFAEALRGDAAVVAYKGGRRNGRLVDDLRRAGRLDGAVFGADLGTERERIAPAAALGDAPAPYMSTLLVPARSAR